MLRYVKGEKYYISEENYKRAKNAIDSGLIDQDIIDGMKWSIACGGDMATGRLKIFGNINDYVALWEDPDNCIVVSDEELYEICLSDVKKSK